jgi:hypothetical protein
MGFVVRVYIALRGLGHQSDERDVQQARDAYMDPTGYIVISCCLQVFPNGVLNLQVCTTVEIQDRHI